MISCDIFALALLQRAKASGIELSHLKLQKLVYYCQGYHLALNDEPIFPEPIEAWEHGPVVPQLYRNYRVFGDGVITVPDSQNFMEKLSESALQILDFVMIHLGSIGAWKLRNKTHSETPWLSHYDRKSCTVDSAEITHEQLNEFFKSEVSNLQDTVFANLLDSVDDEVISMPSNITTEEDFYNWIMSS